LALHAPLLCLSIALPPEQFVLNLSPDPFNKAQFDVTNLALRHANLWMPSESNVIRTLYARITLLTPASKKQSISSSDILSVTKVSIARQWNETIRLTSPSFVWSASTKVRLAWLCITRATSLSGWPK
jgi:hypothetical protein